MTRSRRHHIIAGLTGFIWLASSATILPAATQPAAGWTEIASRTLPATVNIEVSKVALEGTDPDTGDRTTPGELNQFYGSGFIIDPSGVIVTNKHVVDGASVIMVTLQDGTVVNAKVLGMAPLIDLALLKIDVAHPLPTLSFGNGDAAQPGAPVLAIGDPLGIGTSLSSEIVSGTQRDLMNSPYDDYIQTDAAINHGNSGGPLVDMSGRVIGVNSILYTNQVNEGSNGVGFAISSNIVSVVVDHLLHPPSRFGWIGVHIQGMTPELSRALQAPRSGALVTKVDAQSAASAAGVRAGDLILGFDGKHPKNARSLMTMIATTPIGAKRQLEFWSTGTLRDVDVTVRAWRQTTEGSDDNVVSCISPPQPDLGMLLEPISPLDRQIFNLSDSNGLVVVAVNPTSEAYGRGFRPGVVIELINGEPVTTRESARRILDHAAATSPVVAILVNWSKGPSWFALHTSYEAKSAPSAGTITRLIMPCMTGEADASSGQAQGERRQGLATAKKSTH